MPSCFKKSQFPLVLVLLFISLTTSQIVIVRNLGCKSFDSNNVCTQCSTRYYLDGDKICQPVNPNCNTYDATTGGCLSCYPGFGIVQNTCLPGVTINTFDVNCNTFNGSACIKCSLSYYLDGKGKCSKVNPSCKTSDNNGLCLSCFGGYEVVSGTCLVSQAKMTAANCNQMDVNGNCVKCSNGFYFNINNQCIQQDPNCFVFDLISKSCTACYPGYALNQQFLCLATPPPPLDPNCAKLDSNNLCLQCSKGSFFNTNHVCTLIDPSCLTYDQTTGYCLTCYAGYSLDQKAITCIVAPTQTNNNPYCAKWNANICTSCSFGSYFDANSICVVIDPNCKTNINGICTSCYPGYALNNESCVKSTDQPSSNPLCAQWNGSICVQCSKGTYPDASNNNLCTLSNPLCETFEPRNGNCLTCFSGYDLLNGNCMISKNISVNDPNCKSYTNKICTQCSDRYFLAVNAQCQEVNPLCKDYDKTNGNCVTCYAGYALNNITCSASVQTLADPNCQKWQDNTCILCSYGSYFGVNNLCTLADPLCQTFNSTNGFCLTCYSSYVLSSTGKCMKDTNNIVSDGNCAQFLQGLCVKCSTGYYFGTDGRCAQIDSQCKLYNNATGQCLACYLGYTLSTSNLCVKANNTTLDPNCAKFINQLCVKCSQGFYFGSNGFCAASNALCLTFNPLTGQCESCYQSYVLQSGACMLDMNNTLSDPYCASWQDGVCLACAQQTFFNSLGKCQPVDKSCNTFNDQDGSCTSCFPGFQISKKTCIISLSPNSCITFDLGGKCINCSKGSYLQNGLCIQIDTQCQSFDLTSLQCISCYPGYAVLSGTCQVSKVDMEYQVQNCYAYKSPQNSCISCYDRYFLSANTCNNVNVFCKTYNSNNGNCTGCYSSFVLVNGQCLQPQ